MRIGNLIIKKMAGEKLMFFHPKVSYKEHKNDEELINGMQGDKIYEVALSFDKPYKPNEIFLRLPKMTWFWVDTYSNDQPNEFQQVAKENDWSSTFIREREALGFSINTTVYVNLKIWTMTMIDFLQLTAKVSISPDHQNAYYTMKDRKVEDVEILGVVVYGTKDEFEELLQSPMVKASSLGGVIENY